MIIYTKYIDLIKFLHPGLREERDIPLVDNFILSKDLNNKDLISLNEFNNYIVLSQYFYTSEWGRQEIVDFVIRKNRSRRKPKFDWMSDQEFEKAIKIFYVCDYWDDNQEESTVLELFQNINSNKRIKLFFELKRTKHPLEILYSVLTFVKRCLDENSKYEVSPGYLRIIESKRSVIKRNFDTSIKQLAKSNVYNIDMKVLNFIISIGEI